MEGQGEASGKEIVSYTIITAEPNALVGKIHPRMPAMLRREDEAVWLDPDKTEPAELMPLLQPYPADEMEEWRVGDAARNPRNEIPDIIKRFSN